MPDTQYRYQLNAKAHLRQAWTIVFAASTLIVFPAYFLWAFGSDSLGFGFTAAAAVFFLTLTPQIVLHARYWYLNKGVSITFDTNTKTITWKCDCGESTHPISDIRSASTVVSLAKLHGQARWFPWDSYFYSWLEFADGTKVCVTSLLVPELQWPINLSIEEVHGATYCWPSSR